MFKEELQISLGADVRLREVKHGIRLLKKEVAAGDDGNTSELYQGHADLSAVLFVRTFNVARATRALPSDMMKGIVAVLYKKGDPRLLTNYRGLTMLQRSYVLLATVMALRLWRPAVTHLLHCGGYTATLGYTAVSTSPAWI